MRVAEDMTRSGPLRTPTRVRVDLHGVSCFGRGQRTLIRWEWISAIEVSGGVVVRSDRAELTLPAGAFGRRAEDLAALLQRARAIDQRPEVIAELAGSPDHARS